MHRIQQFLITTLNQEYDRLFLWVPVLFASGIGIYFSLTNEPWMGWGALSVVLCLALVRLCWHYFLPRLAVAALLFVVAGFTVAQLKTTWLATPMITSKMKDAEFEGRISHIEHRPHDVRLTFVDMTFLSQLDQTAPRKVRVTVKGGDFQLGQTLRVKAVLLPIRENILPGSYDFAFHAYFMGLGAVGFITDPPVVLKTEPVGWLNQLRHDLTQSLRHAMPDETGGIAAALITGDRNGINKTTRQNFADAGVAHILAISGLHLSILAGLVFLLIRRGLCFIPGVALNVQTKKWAAVLAIAVIFVYLMLCGAATPALRAFCMTGLVLLAVLVDRSALTLRNVALAALFILIFWPETLLGPSFQLSFAAVIGIIAAYESYRSAPGIKTFVSIRIPKSIVYISAIVSTTLLASLATMPYTIYTFNRFALYSIPANMVAIPLTTFWVMPSALLTVLATPFGLQEYPALLLSKGIGVLQVIANQVAGWPNAAVLVPQISIGIIVALTLGSLWFLIWRGRKRWWGLPVVAASVALMIGQKGPVLFVSQDYALIGFKHQDTLWVNTSKRGAFIADNWAQMTAVADVKPIEKHPDFTCDKKGCYGQFNQKTFAFAASWRDRLKTCSAVMLSFSYNPKWCNPEFQTNGRDTASSRSVAYYDLNESSRLMTPSRQRLWTN